MKTQIVIIPQWFLDKYKENFTPMLVASLVAELNASRPVVGENHVNLKLGVVERAFYQPGVGVVVEATIATERASNELRAQLNNFYSNPSRNIFASLAGSFETTPKQRCGTTLVELLASNPNVRINHIQPVEVSLLSRSYNPAIAGSMLRHREDADSILMADFDLNNGAVKRNMTTEEKKDAPPPADISDKEFDTYLSTIQEDAYKQGLEVGSSRSALEDGIKKHEIDLDDAEKKIYEEYQKTDKRPTEDMTRVIKNLRYTIGVMDRRAAKKAEATKKETAAPEGEKKKETAAPEAEKKDVPPRANPPEKSIEKGKDVPQSKRALIKAYAEKLKKEASG